MTITPPHASANTNTIMLNLGAVAHAAATYGYFKVTHGVVDHLFFGIAGEVLNTTLRATMALIYPTSASEGSNDIASRFEAAAQIIAEGAQENFAWAMRLRPSQITAEMVGHELIHLLSIESHEWVIGGGLVALEHMPYVGAVVTKAVKPLLSFIPENIVESVGFKDNFMLNGEHAATSIGALYNACAAKYELFHELSHSVDLASPAAHAAMQGKYGAFLQEKATWVVDGYDHWIDTPYNAMISGAQVLIYEGFVLAEEYVESWVHNLERVEG